MNEFMDLFNNSDVKDDKSLSIGNIKLSLRNYLYLEMIKSWVGDDNACYSKLLNAIIHAFIEEHKDEIKALKEKNNKNNSDWLVDILFGE